MKKKNPHRGSSLDDFLKEEGIYDEVVVQVDTEVIAWQLEQAMKKKKITKKRMAELMKTSRTQVDKLLNPKDGNVTIKTLHKAAAVVGCWFARAAPPRSQNPDIAVPLVIRNRRREGRSSMSGF